MKLIVRLVIAGSLLCTMSCTLFRDPVSKYINRTYPPVDEAMQRERAIKTAEDTLAVIPAPGIAFGTPTATVERVLNTNAVKALGIRSVQVTGEEQLLRLDVAFQKQFTEPGDELQRLRPEVSGSIRFYAGITSATTTAADTSLIRLELLPAFSRIKIDRVKVRGKYDVSALGTVLSSVLNAYANNITGELSRSPLMRITIPTGLPQTQDIIRLEKGEGTLSVGAHPVQMPVRLLGVAWLITSNAITGIAQTVPVEPIVVAAEARETAPFRTLRERFEATFRRAFDTPGISSGPWVAVRKDLLAQVTNSVVQQASFCTSGDAEIPYERFNEVIRFPDESTIACDVDKDCTPTRPCNFPPQVDTRNCSICLLWRPGPPFGDGGCAQHGNDPFCEAAKAAQNAAYIADAALKKFDCERIKEQERIGCEAEKATKKALCEAGKEFMKQLSRTGDFGRIEGGMRARTQGLGVCLKTFTLSPKLDRLEMTLGIRGRAAADVDIKFTPLNILGHLTCQVPWTDSQTFNLALAEEELTLKPRIRFVTNGPNARIHVTLPKGEVPMVLQPGPTEYLMKNVNMTLACAGLNLIKPILLVATPFVPELRGRIPYKYDEKEISIDVPMPRQQVGELSVTGRLDQTKTALYLVGDVQ